MGKPGATSLDLFMQIHVGDWQKEAPLLEPAARGLHVSLMIESWCQGGRLPSDERLLARAARVDREDFHPLWEQIRGLWVEEQGTVHHPSTAGMLDRARGVLEKKSRGGRKGAARRWVGGADDGTANGTATSSANDTATSSANGSPNAIPRSEIRDPRSGNQDPETKGSEIEAGASPATPEGDLDPGLSQEPEAAPVEPSDSGPGNKANEAPGGCSAGASWQPADLDFVLAEAGPTPPVPPAPPPRAAKAPTEKQLAALAQRHAVDAFERAWREAHVTAGRPEPTRWIGKDRGCAWNLVRKLGVDGKPPGEQERAARELFANVLAHLERGSRHWRERGAVSIGDVLVRADELRAPPRAAAASGRPERHAKVGRLF